MVADGVDPAVHPMQPTLLRTLGNSVAAQTHLFELPQRHHTVLVRGDLIEAVIGGVEFVAHGSTKSTEASSSPPTPLLFRPLLRLRRCAAS